MKNLLKKVRGDKKGFTLAELLVVVAIIGILVAISVPLFTAQLGKARKATNQANMRAAKAAAVAEYISDESSNGNTKGYTYDLKAGTVSSIEDAAPNAGAVEIDNAASNVTYNEIKVYVTVDKTTVTDGKTTTTTEVKIYPSHK